MGANAQTSVPLFSSGEVLTAANQNLSAGTGVPVFATTTTRDAAFGGTGEKVLAEGQLCYIEASDVVQYYNGSTWATLAPATPGALVYITGATFTTAATVSFASGVFTSTYDNYIVTLNLTASSADQDIAIRVNNAGTARTAANYYGSKTSINAAGTSVNAASNAATSHNAMRSLTAYITLGAVINVFAPTATTTNTSWTVQAFGAESTSSANIVSGCTYNALEAHDGLTFVVGGTISGKYRVYGVANS
jgi:hypothetical protein